MPDTTPTHSAMTAPPRTARRAAWLACALGLLHAAFSLYWALGGRGLLDTVGQGPEQMIERLGLSLPVALLGVTVFKGLAAVIPLLNLLGRLPWPGLWRGVSWVGATVLILYGGANMLAGWGVLSGLIASPGYNRAAMQGHAFLWDPLFLLWGLALAWSLWHSTPTRRGTS